MLFNKYFSGDTASQNEMDRTCGTCGGQEKCRQDFGGKAGQLEGLVVDGGKNTTMNMQEIGWGLGLD